MMHRQKNSCFFMLFDCVGLVYKSCEAHTVGQVSVLKWNTGGTKNDGILNSKRFLVNVRSTRADMCSIEKSSCKCVRILIYSVSLYVCKKTERVPYE